MRYLQTQTMASFLHDLRVDPAHTSSPRRVVTPIGPAASELPFVRARSRTPCSQRSCSVALEGTGIRLRMQRHTSTTEGAAS